ncbi:DHH family phosphoesterase [Paramaledivibacter caminithermalis]|uniref:Cyclic-di-AMP phosphodiesterase n=1 Tax=Paramaledivibacter caminithermalis (strain DSM 15212 / CIP 107654 / DViRD3) TaxID=1121301 RepID=A0A1M6ND57_PARC5|nr:DHH family phosphoesterase [Paramaledivibacter caminithermalis]SHJ93536.1 c-di-AMP phosphodiesterase, consists of a GGDEF-like and DHH domains [Paramaledivibacter caminithermalis DSM 15212]
MNNKRFLKILIPDTKIYLWIIVVMVMIIFMYNLYLGVFGVALLAYLIYHSWKSNHVRKEKWKKYIENLSAEIDSVARYSLLNLPMPLTIVEFDGSISWYNSKFIEMMEEKDILDKNIEEIVPAIDINKLLEENERIKDIKIKDKIYRVRHSIVKLDNEHEERYIIMLYWLENTNFYNLKTKYNNEKPNVAFIQIDNYDDVLKETDEEYRPLVIAEIDRSINIWVSRMNGLVKKYQKDKYLVVFENRYLDNLEAKRFTILDDIREIDLGNKIPPTLSIGVGVNGKNLSRLEEFASSALELALGRGGDQAVVRKIDSFEFYGGKTKAVEKRNKVKARIIAHALRQLIDQSDKIIIMGHQSPDMDSFGAAIGVYRAAINRDKKAYIVLNKINAAIENVYSKFKDKEEYNFITCDEAVDIFGEKDLIVVVDTHRPGFTECPQLINKSNRTVLIDHHRRGTEFIENTVLTYLQPYASSTCELVTEILQYMDTKINLEKIEAEAMLGGITVDTKNFALKTGVRTFEAASLLRRAGADTTEVRQLFQDDITTFIAKANVVRNAEIVKDGIAISVCDENIKNPQLVVAQGADELLNIRGINTSFVIGTKEDNIVFISGRSLGDINVQRILEKLGGGGHLTVAGAQLKDVTTHEVKNMLINSIEEYLEEGDK